MPFINDWRYIVWALLALGLGVPLASVGNFLPQIVARLGYNTVKTNLYTVAPVRDHPFPMIALLTMIWRLL